jgi:hypothetical protein
MRHDHPVLAAVLFRDLGGAQSPGGVSAVWASVANDLEGGVSHLDLPSVYRTRLGGAGA